MGSKSNPGDFDCYDKAEPDEPMFVLLGRDPTASLVVAFWVQLRRQLGETDEKMLDEAERCAVSLESWAREHDKAEKVDQAFKYILDQAKAAAR